MDPNILRDIKCELYHFTLLWCKIPHFYCPFLGKKDRMKGRIRETTNKNNTDNKKK